MIATDIRSRYLLANDDDVLVFLDATDRNSLDKIVSQNRVTQIYLLAAMLSATGEQQPLWSWGLNMQSLINVLECAR